MLFNDRPPILTWEVADYIYIHKKGQAYENS
jgi:hypothetical protein